MRRQHRCGVEVASHSYFADTGRPEEGGAHSDDLEAMEEDVETQDNALVD